MSAYTFFLAVLEEGPDRCQVLINAGSPAPAIANAMERATDVRYSPILPAYLLPGSLPETPTASPAKLAFLFSRRPYYALGTAKPALTEAERQRTFFTEGLASIVLVDFADERLLQLLQEFGSPPVETWTLDPPGTLSRSGIRSATHAEPANGRAALTLPEFSDPVLAVYCEQIAASIASLWAFYSRHHEAELATLVRLMKLVEALTAEYTKLCNAKESLTGLKGKNAIISALVELCASLSYSVTQGSSGASPILENRSPFAHHSLLGIGGAVCGLTYFVRYLENAFNSRDAASVVEKQYSSKAITIPSSIPNYQSGPQYKLGTPAPTGEEFDTGGDFVAIDPVPLLAHFSLRHGFKETKFSVTAASEALSAECLPAWTMMTLSHEIMHSRVRGIFQSLFGLSWSGSPGEANWVQYHIEYSNWQSERATATIKGISSIRCAVLNFCLACDRAEPVTHRRDLIDKGVTVEILFGSFQRHRRLAIELFVHFHDYYFAYACQASLYLKSLWASWLTVAAPVARPEEYLLRSLATVSCGTGQTPGTAFASAVETLEEALSALEEAGIKSALFAELRGRLASNDAREALIARFKPAYYLIDQVRMTFASQKVSRLVDRLDSDPFADGSNVAEEYAASVYVHGDANGASVSPVRHSLAALVRQLSGDQQISDLQWLTAWNSLVISSQETKIC